MSCRADLSHHAHTLIEEYHIAGDVTRLRVRDSSPLVGLERAGFRLTEYPGLTLAGIFSHTSTGCFCG